MSVSGFNNLQSHPRQSCDSAIQRFNGLLVDEKWNDANECDTFLAHPRFFVGIACDNDFTEGVMYVGQRKKLLFALGFVRDLPRALVVDALRLPISDKVDFELRRHRRQQSSRGESIRCK